MMTAHLHVVRHNEKLRETLTRSSTSSRTASRGSSCPDRGALDEPGSPFVRQLRNMLVLARSSPQGALARDESRGAHYKPEFPKRDDANWLKTTIATYDPKTRGPTSHATSRSTRRSSSRGRAMYGQGGRRQSSHGGHRQAQRSSARTGPTSEPYWQDFEVERRPSMNVHLLPHGDPEEPGDHRRRADAPVVWDCTCLEEVCGSARCWSTGACGSPARRWSTSSSSRSRSSRCASSRSCATSSSTGRRMFET